MSESSINQPTPREAAEALRRSREIDQTVRTRSGWHRNYLLVYAAGTVLLALAVGLAPFPASFGLGVVVWILATAAVAAWSRRQPVSAAGFSRTHLMVMGIWAALWVAVVVPGSIWFLGNRAWWVPGALLTAVPPLAAYARKTRR